MRLEYLSETHDPFWFAEACRRVQQGIALLDERGPEGWRQRINILALDMGHPFRDVLGQLYGSYHRGMCALFGEDWSALDPKTGRSVTSFGFEPFLKASKFMMTDAWRKELWLLR